MDPLTKKEINGLKSDIQAKNAAIESYKAMFAKQLKDYIGPEIDNTLSNIDSNNQTIKKHDLFHKILNALTLWRRKNP